MPNPRVKNKLNQMIKSGLVEEFIDKNGKRLYRLTPKGVKTRNRIREMVLFLGELGLLPVDKDRLK
jgi:DNA-binding PadR family transcriptional regulator